jgi:hypothetical protein
MADERGDARHSLLWHRLIVRNVATMDQLNAVVALMKAEPGLDLGPALIKMGVVTAEQVVELESLAGKVRMSCRGCGKEQEVNARLLKAGVSCPECKAPMDPIIEEAAAAAEPAPAPPAPPPVSIPPSPAVPFPLKPVLIGTGAAGAVIVAIVIAIATRPSPKRPPEDDALPPPASNVTPETPKKPAPPPADSLEARVAALREKEKAAPDACRTLHKAWIEILDMVKGTPEEIAIREKLDEIESRANKLYREAYRPVQEAVRDLVGARKPLEAHQRLLGWTPPAELELDGSRAAERAKELAALAELIALEQRRSAIDSDLRGGKDVDPTLELKSHLGSDHVAVRAEAERSVEELRVLRAVEQIKRRLAGRRDGALARVEQARKQAIADAADEATRLKRWQTRAAEQSAKKPWPLKTFGVDLPETVGVKSFTASTVTFAGSGMEFTWALDVLKPEILGEILVMAADSANGRDCLEAGKWAVRRGAFTAAERLFELAVRADRSLAPMVPDLARIRRGVASVRGELQVAADQLAIVYNFRNDEQLKDFQATEGARVARSGSGLEVSGRGLFYGLLKEMQFAGRVKISAATAGLTTQGGYILGVSYEVSPAEFDEILLVVQSNGVWRIFRRSSRGNEVELARGELESARTLELAFEGTRASVSAGGGAVWTGNVDSYDRVQVLIGGVDYGGGGSAVSYSSLKITGRASPSWIQRLHAERSSVVEAELAKEAKATKEELAAAPVSGRPFAAPPLAALPIEAEVAPSLPPRVAEKLKAARDLLGRFARARTAEAWDRLVDGGRQILDDAVREAPWFGPALYYRAEWRYALEGQVDGALADLAEAVKVQPALVEARMARAGLLLDRSDGVAAERELAAALEAVPDFAAARLLRARLLYFAGRTSESLAELELAWRLAPGDPAMRRAAKRLKNAVAGPLWPASESVDTANYRIRGQVPTSANAKEQAKAAAAVKARLRAYADRLEAARAWFPQVAAGTPRRSEKARMYVFGSAEGYYVYADFTQSDRMEHSVGCFIPDLRQLLFFEDTSASDTIETMVHEAFHEYLDTIAPGAPSWLNEGMAEYVAGAVVEDGKVTGVATVKGRLRFLQAWMAQGDPLIGFATIMGETQAQFYQVVPQLQYAQAWAMVHFFRHGAMGRYRLVLEKYIELLVKDKGADEAYAETFGKADLATMQREFIEYVRRLE